VTPGAPAPPLDLDEFRLVRVLGHGGMGAVYLGYDTVLEREVAIKLLRDRADDDARIRFLTEARAIARLDHPNVIAIFRAGTTRAGHPYLVQELVRGQSLDQLALPIAPERVLAIGLGIARGLAAAHRHGILHRDVKPANVMLDDDGTPRLLDFGVAKLTGRAAHEAASGRGAGQATETREIAETRDPLPADPATVAETLDPTPAGPRPDATTQAAGRPATEAGAIVGTPRYMAPEIWRGEPATARSDLYSLGALLYELATGAPPYPDTDRAALERAVLRGPPAPPPRERAPALAPELAEIIAACLARDPAGRPQTADEVAHRIERILLGAPPVPDGNPYPGLAPFGDPHRAVFYGRGTDITAIVDRLRAAPLVVVAGDSGIGKSSLCRAGVLPAIAAGGLGDRRTWRTRTVLVGRHAAAALCEALGLERSETGGGDPDGSAGGAGGKAPRGIDAAAAGRPAEPAVPAPVPTIDQIARAAGASADTGLLVFVDQLEELITLNEPDEAARAAAILASLARGVPGVRLLVAVRGDFLTRVAALPVLGTAMTRSLHLLRPLSPADARDAVVGPARAKGVRFETDALVDALASSIAEQPGALPLLSFALAELWQRRDPERGVIPAAALDAIGGVAGGLARHADAVIGALGEAERIAARRIALRLVTRADTRAERDRGELCPDEDPAAAAALEAMIRGRLVAARHTATGAPVYELAHDSLITAWATLQTWRDDVAGQRALRTRLAAAADDWRRLGRRRDALWNRAQLAEAAALDELSDGDRAFLAASRAAATGRRIAAIALAASLPAVAIATALVLQHRSRAARDRDIAAHVAAAEQHLAAGRIARDDALRDRGEAFRRFDAYDADAEPTWRAALAELATARAGYAAATRELELALLGDSVRDDLRARMAGALFELAALAELAGDAHAAGELVGRLAAFDRDGARTAAWNAPASLSIDAPGAAQIAVRRYVDRSGRLDLGPPIARADRPRLDLALPASSYAIELTGRDGLVVNDPVRLERGEALRLDVPLPRAADVPPGMVYVPAGRFLSGDGSGNESYRINFLSAAPLHPATTAAYLIARTEVTFGDWIAYLRALPPAEREARRPRGSSSTGATLQLDGGRSPGEPFTLVILPAVRQLVAREGEPLIYPGRTARRAIRWEDAPVSGVSLDDARAYTAWLARAGRVPGARVCNEREWERAARGADGRIWAHGNRIEPDDANIDVTYRRDALAWGPDAVGAHPASTSPFGLVDTVGNVWEWVEPAPGPTAPRDAILRGGSWYQGNASAQAANREPSAPEVHSTLYGLRICATPR
jgi:eukaryotic-like serine/threonine-protein kinase